jgi:DNA (cytosine-5)-methyltransferase 1
MIVVDLFSKAGGAGEGYRRAGFEVVGVDREPQPNYPGRVIVADALEVLKSKWVRKVAAVHASPPCQGYSTQTADKTKHERLIAVVREMLEKLGVPWVIENVEGAKGEMQDPVRLCGSAFGLDVRRHRYFETNWPVVGVQCNHAWQTPRFRSLDMSMVRKGTLAGVVGVHGHINYPGEGELRARAMGIDWMTQAELAEAIPPAYTEWIGRQMYAYIKAQRGEAVR